jgi:hypothetical protein
MSNMYVVSDSLLARSAEISDALPWTVLLTLGSLSRKHVFIRNQRIQTKSISVSSQDLVRKLKWAWHFHKNPNAGTGLPLLKSRPRVFPSRIVVDPEVEGFSIALRNCMSGCVKAANRSIAGGNAAACNTPRYARHAVTWIANSGLRVVSSDKDGVFVLLSESVLRTLLSEQMVPEHYRAVSHTTVEVEFEHVCRGIRALSRGLKRLGKIRWASDVRSCLEDAKPRDLVGRINCTIKTHKPAGELSARVLHASQSVVTRGLALALHQALATKLNEIPHLCLRTDCVVRRLGECSFGPDVVLCKVDIKNYYMSGPHDLLVQNVVCSFDIPVSSWIQDALGFVLFYQYVALDDQYFQVVSGSGMGAQHSSNATDLAFYNHAERRLNWQEHGVLLYLRFRDDVFFVAENRTHAMAFIERLSRAAAPWRLEVETISSLMAVMLDLMVFKGPRFRSCGKLDYRPHIKPTARHVPLSARSCHPEHVHRSWPISEISRMRRLSLHSWSFLHFRERMLYRFRKFYMRPDILHRCAEWLPSSVRRRAQDIPASCVRLRAVVRYHPCLRSLPGKLAKLCADWGEIVGRCFHATAPPRILVQVAFQNAARPLFIVLRRGRI